jgi:hypothetical protein
MSPRIDKARMSCGSRVKRLPEAPPGGLLTWHPTEFGRRSACERYRIIFKSKGWQLLDANWDPLAEPTDMQSAMLIAERLARLARPRQ